MKPLEEQELLDFRGWWNAETDRLTNATPRGKYRPLPHEQLAHAMLLRMFVGWEWFDCNTNQTGYGIGGNVLVAPWMTEDAIGFAGPVLRHVSQTIAEETLQVAVRGMVAYDQVLYKRWLKANPLATNLDKAIKILHMEGYNFG